MKCAHEESKRGHQERGDRSQHRNKVGRKNMKEGGNEKGGVK